ncbi:MAG: MltA domain-containing protein [Syntrophales bacterium]|jgi:membrane-bound lytic murein transglycosylase A|nr:MltA domain-containing protein [Syntrophales bacterium]
MKVRERIIIFLILFPAFFLAGCAPISEMPRAESRGSQSPFASVEDAGQMDDLDLDSLGKAVDLSIQYYEKAGSKGSYCLRDRCYSYREMIDGLKQFLKIMRRDMMPAEVEQKIRDEFIFVSAAAGTAGAGAEGNVLVTGYFEPILEGSRTKTDRFRYPLYKIPDETVVVPVDRAYGQDGRDKFVGRLHDGEVIPHFSRREIDENGVLAGRGLEIAWVDDPVALFLLHIQGSGKIRLPEGRLLHVTYAQSNGWPFRGLTGMMVEKGLLQENGKSYEQMKRFLLDHPEERQELMNYNERYIFFRTATEGPLGALNLPLVAGRSIATDLDIYPRGALALIKTRKPVFDGQGRISSWQSFSRFVLNHDTGAAIKGPGRVDLFCGTGETAERTAGAMKESGELYFLVKKK